MTSDESCKEDLQKCESLYSCQHPPDQTCRPTASDHSWPAPANPVLLSDIEALEFLHRGDESFVTLHRKIHGQWEDIGAIGISQARDRVPIVREYLEIDSYFSINSTYPRKKTFKVSPLTGLPIYSRCEKYLRWLNALYVDLDAGHTSEQLCFACLRKSLFAELAGSGLPVPSILVESG